MNSYQKFTPKLALNLMAPHTWPAAIMPALLAFAATSTYTSTSISLSFCMLLIVILMQSAVNTFNDYYDFKKGTDDNTSILDPSDAVLVYNNINPKSVLYFAWCLLLSAFILGIYPIVCAGFVPLCIALIGALFVLLYSAGKTPISYLPIGEIVSGSVMGGLIPVAYFYVLTGDLSPYMLLWSIPEIIGIALIMFTNNSSDIERDSKAGRNTLAVSLGRQKSRILYRVLIILWLLAIVINVAIWFRDSLVYIPFALLACLPLIQALIKNPLTQENRKASMPQILSLNIALGSFYALCIAASNTVAFYVL